MRPGGKRRRVVRHNKDRKIFAAVNQIIQNRRDYLLVNKFNSFNLVFYLMTVSGFIRSFKMNIHEIIIAFKGVNCGFCFAVKVCVYISCCAFNL